VIARHLHGQTVAWLEAGRASPRGWPRTGKPPASAPAHCPHLQAAAERAHRALREGERIAFLLRAADIAQAADRHDEAFELVHSAILGHMNTIRQADGLPLLARQAQLARTPLQHARVAGNRAWYAAVLGDLPTALAIGQHALQMAQPLGDAALTAIIRQRLGTALVMAARFDEALPHMRSAEPGWKAAPRRWSAQNSTAIWRWCWTTWDARLKRRCTTCGPSPTRRQKTTTRNWPPRWPTTH
jgi:tetratricopeptide (TPR) repeat protein